MTIARLAALPILACALAACQSEAEQQADVTEEQIEHEADLVTADGTDLGDVEQVRRGADGMVDGLLVSIEDSDPDRYVVVPLDGLTTRPDGDDTDVQTAMTAQDLAALPDAPLDANTAATPAG